LLVFTLLRDVVLLAAWFPLSAFNWRLDETTVMGVLPLTTAG